MIGIDSNRRDTHADQHIKRLDQQDEDQMALIEILSRRLRAVEKKAQRLEDIKRLDQQYKDQMALIQIILHRLRALENRIHHARPGGRVEPWDGDR